MVVQIRRDRDLRSDLARCSLTWQVVRLVDLKARAELNNKKGRVTGFREDVGRLAVKVNAPLAFGGVEKLTLALLPANLLLIPPPPEIEELSENEDERKGKVSWAKVRHGGLQRGWMCAAQQALCFPSRPAPHHATMRRDAISTTKHTTPHRTTTQHNTTQGHTTQRNPKQN